MKRPQAFVRRQTPLAALLVGWAALSLVLLVLLATRLLGETATVTVDDYASMLAPAAAAVACLRASRRVGGESGRAWLLMSLSLFCWTVGGLIWTIYEIHLGAVVPFPGWADVGYLSSVPFAVAALLAFPGAQLSGAARLRPVLDGGIAAGSLLFLSWTTLLGPAFDAGTGSFTSQATTLAYPASDVVVATMALLALSRARGQLRTTMLLVSMGLLFIAVADSAYAWFTAHGGAYDTYLFDTGYLAGYLLIGAAALQYQTPVEASRAEAADGVAAPVRLSMALPYTPLLLSLPMAAVLQLRGHPLDKVQLAAIVLTTVAVLLRQLLSLRAIGALSVELHETVGALRDREVELHHQAFHDPLTGLANRSLFADRIDHALTRTRRPGPVLLLLADLDDFKAVNDTLGHPAGDRLLIMVAERLRAVVRPEDTVARLGGDEFAILLETAEGLDDAVMVAERIASAMLQPFYLEGIHTVIGASIGIAAADDAASAEAMLRDADIAMYSAKGQGKGRCAVYAAHLAAANLSRLQLKSDLSQALTNEELSVKYLPIVDLDSGQMTGVEALLRWEHPTEGSVPRGVMIPLAESTGDIVPIGRWVLEQACLQAGAWYRQRPGSSSGFTLAVNVSGRQLTNPQLVPAVKEALAAAGLPPHLLTLEITESVLLDADTALAPLLALRELGVHLAIDDFGTGHSTLSRLRRYPVDTLKIDQSFVKGMALGASIPDVLVRAILALGHGLDMAVIAEGIETEGQLNALRDLGCRSGQGFLFAQPAEADVITELLDSGIALADPVITAVDPR